MNVLITKCQMAKGKARLLLIVFLLPLAGCDGGIFGTGAADEMLDTSIDNADSEQPNVGSIPGVNTDGDAGGSDNMTVDSIAGESTTNGAASAGSTDGNSSGDASGSTDAGSSDAGTTDTGTTDSANTESDGNDEQGFTVFTDRSSSFANTQATLTSSDARLNLINTGTQPINVFESDAINSMALFAANGITPNTISNTVNLRQTNTNIAIVDNNNRETIFVEISPFTAEPSTFTTIVVRQNGQTVDALALITETTTNDTNLAQVRVIQANSLGNAATEADFALQSAGANPGGVDVNFEALSYNRPVTGYIDIPSGDYELIDSAGRINAQAISFDGGVVYTLIVRDEQSTVLILNDSVAANALTP